MVTKRHRTDAAFHPGGYIAEELAARGMTQRELARQMGRPYQVVNEIVRGRKVLTADTALDLEKAWGISADTWLNLQQAYDLAVARRRRTVS